MSLTLLILCLLTAFLAANMLFARNPITTALSLLGVLILTAGIYGLIGEHFVATIQLVVYAGAIMVLFVFSIMLLNLSQLKNEEKTKKGLFLGGLALGLTLFGLIAYGIKHHFAHFAQFRSMGPFSPEVIEHLGGNSKVLAHALYSQYYVSFEVISLALLVAVVGAVVLAKRKID